jgi:hypothetical protein
MDMESEGYGASNDKRATAIRDRVTVCPLDGHQTSSLRDGAMESAAPSAPKGRDSLFEASNVPHLGRRTQNKRNRSPLPTVRPGAHGGAAPAYGGGSRPPQDGCKADAANWQQETQNLRIAAGYTIAQLAFRP